MSATLRRLRCALVLLGVLVGLVTVPPAAAEDRVLAVFVPGVHFASLEQRLELGNELAAHLVARLGERYRLTPRVYASVEAMDADAARIALALVESPLVATRLGSVLPVSVATVPGAGPGGAAGSDQTRLVVMASPSVRVPTELRRTGLAFAAPTEAPQVLLDNLLFEGELSVPREVWQPTRDVSSALSLASLHKAEAVLLYEDDTAAGRQAALRLLYTSERLPRPTVVMLDRKADGAELGRLREALAQFHGQVHPGLRAFRATAEPPYQALRVRLEKRARRAPMLIELVDEQVVLPQPKPTATSLVPLRAYAPE